MPDLIQEKTNLTIRYKPETKSTQTDAKEGIEAGNNGNTLYLSTCQTAGRGRFQRPYYSPSQGGSICPCIFNQTSHMINSHPILSL